jgi:two-component system OmpR family response regulator
MFAEFFKKKTPSEKLLFIVEDNEAYAKSLKLFLQGHFKIKEIEIFRLGELCLMELHREPGIIIMDYILNSEFKSAYDGLETIKRIKASKPETNIIVLSAQEKFNVISEAIKEYDCSYVKKDNDAFLQVELLIKEILSRKPAPPISGPLLSTS